MTKLFCDRCGKEIAERKDRTRVMVEESPVARDSQYDLCEDCYEELKKFLEPSNMLAAARRLTNWQPRE